jgi:hypothetical protein
VSHSNDTDVSCGRCSIHTTAEAVDNDRHHATLLSGPDDDLVFVDLTGDDDDTLETDHCASSIDKSEYPN